MVSFVRKAFLKEKEEVVGVWNLKGMMRIDGKRTPLRYLRAGEYQAQEHNVSFQYDIEEQLDQHMMRTQTTRGYRSCNWGYQLHSQRRCPKEVALDRQERSCHLCNLERS
jgi:hypothetical protein